MAACSQLSTQSADFKLLAAGSTLGRFQSGGHIRITGKMPKGCFTRLNLGGGVPFTAAGTRASQASRASRRASPSRSHPPTTRCRTWARSRSRWPRWPPWPRCADRAGCAGPAAGDGIGVVGALQESYDFAPKFLFHRLVHKLEGSLVLHDALLDGHCILLDGRFGALRIHPALPGEFLQGFDAVLVQIQLW